jgi:hypothetical protein
VTSAWQSLDRCTRRTPYPVALLGTLEHPLWGPYCVMWLSDFFYPFVARASTGENHLGPRTVHSVFVLGALMSNFPLNYRFMRHPISGSAAAWGVFVWKEFHGANIEARRELALMFTLFVLGLLSISLTPVFG